MRRIILAIALLIPLAAAADVSVFLGHQSVGRYIIAEPGHYDDTNTPPTHAGTSMRDSLAAGIALWDHDYSNYTYGDYDGFTGPDGETVGWASGQGFGRQESPYFRNNGVKLSHLIGDCITASPTTNGGAYRDSLARFDIVIIKPGYRDMHMDADTLATYKTMLNTAADWWHANNPGQYLVVTTAPPLRHYDDYVGTAGFDDAADAVAKAAVYRDFSQWLQNVWVCRHPELRFFDMWYMAVEHTGAADVKWFTKDEYTGTGVGNSSGDHHLNSAGSDAIQAALVDFINGLALDFIAETHETRRMIDLP